MKYLIYLSLIFGFASCETENVSEIQSEGLNLEVSANKTPIYNRGTYTTFYLDFRDGQWKCSGPPWDCLPPVFLPDPLGRPDSHNLTSLVSFIQTSPKENLKSIFLQNLEKFKFVDTELITGVEQGKYSIKFYTNKNKSENVLVFSNKDDGTTLKAYPIIIE